MYTRCPSCRSEISFEPPANKDALPADYKHRIKCPSCGVTIGVKINQSPIAVTPAQTAAPVQQPVQQQPVTQVQQKTPQGTTQIFNISYPAQMAGTSKKAKKQAKRANKKSGFSRNLMMLIFSLVFVAASVAGFLISKEILKLPEKFAWASVTTLFNGISAWELLVKDFESFKVIFSGFNIKLIAVTLMPMFLFTLAGIDLLVAFISMCGRKYSRIFNLVFSVIIGAAAVTIIFIPYLVGLFGEVSLIEYLKVFCKEFYVAVIIAGIGVLQFIFSLIFLKSMKKNKKQKTR